MQSANLHSISITTIFKLVGIGLFFSLFPAMAILGIVCSFGLLTMHYNGEPIHGWQPLVVAPVLGLMIVAMLTAFIGLAMNVGLRLYSLLGPFSITYKPAHEPRA